MGSMGKEYESSMVACINNVKHHRNIHFSEANLKNVLDAIAGLFVLLLFFYGEEAENAKLILLPFILE
jgi:hypothetical protein